MGGVRVRRRYSTTRRQYEIAPSSVTFGDSFPPGEAYVLCYVEVIITIFFYISHTGFANRLPLGEGGPAKPGRMRAGVEGSSAWVIDAPA